MKRLKNILLINITPNRETQNELSTKKIICYLILIGAVLLTGCNKKTQKVYKVGIINATPTLKENIIGFKKGMEELGYIEGKNICYIYNGSTTDINNLPAEAQALVDARVNLIFSVTTPATLAVKKVTSGTNIPVIFSIVTDPVGSGIVNSMNSPGGNISGVAFGVQEAQRLKWLIRIAPKIKKIYVPYNSKDKAPVLALKKLLNVANKLDVKLITYKIYDQKTLNYAVLNIPSEVDAIFLLPDSLVSTRYTDLMTLANKRKLPTSGTNITTSKNNQILTSFGYNQQLYGKQAARLVGQIFNGAKPADLPVETSEFFLMINLKVAKKIGITVPDKILHQADIIIR